MARVLRRVVSVVMAATLATGLMPLQQAAADGGEAQLASDEPVLYSNEVDGSCGQADDQAEPSASGSALSTLATTSEQLSSGVDYITIDASSFSSSWIENSSIQVANEARNGIYFLYGTRLLFLSLDDLGATVAHVFTRVSQSYAADDVLYTLDESSGCVLYAYDLDQNALDHSVDLAAVYEQDGVDDVTALGVDGSGRVYLATEGNLDGEEVYQLWLFSASGTLLSSAAIDVYVDSFAGFADDGSFFMETEYNWVYWGYDHYGNAATMGTVSDDQISFTKTSGSVTVSGLLTYSLDCIEYLYQYGYYAHDKAADVIGGEYLVTASTTYGRTIVWDVDTLSSVVYLARDAIEEEQSDDYTDENSVGVRAVYNEADDSIVIYENGKLLNEYDPDTGEVIGTCSTMHYVYCLMTLGDAVVALEKEDGDYYIEVIDWVAPESFTVSAERTTMKVGQTQQLSLSSSSDYTPAYTWETSDASVASVTDEGIVSSWSEGTATISYTSQDGTASSSVTVTVSGTTVSDDASSTSLAGTVTDNESANDYTVWSSTVESYLYEDDDGGLVRVEYTGDEVLVESYTSAGKLQSSESIDAELSLFGGFFAGEDYNFLVFGQPNTSQSDDVEVVRVVKYTKGWSRVAACGIYGANTYEPFEAGSLRMAEADGALYVYTCHTMYDDGDDVHHQANMTLVVDESTMTYVDGYYDVMNIAQAGYVSHSFNQLIATDGEYVWRVDHGDGAPRAVSLTRASVDGDVTAVAYTYALSIQGSYGANATGVSVGGLALSDHNVLIAGNSVDQDDEDTYSASGQRNVFLTVTDQTYFTTDVVWLTEYSSSDGVTVRTPQLVKLADDRFLVMWEEYWSGTGMTVTRYVTVNGDGDLTSDVTCSTQALSDCQPIATDEGMVAWYVSDGASVTLHSINPYELPDDAFPDVKAGKWYYESIMTVAELGLITGYDNGLFGVGDTMTRAQLAVIMWRIDQPTAAAAYAGTATNTTGMSDVKDDKYYTAAVNWAVANGVFNGKEKANGTRYFDPTGTLTFQEFCAVLANYLDADGRDALSSSTATKTLKAFTDASKVSSWAKKSVAWCVRASLMSGNDNGDGTRSIGPRTAVKRERAATVFANAVNAGVLDL